MILILKQGINMDEPIEKRILQLTNDVNDVKGDLKFFKTFYNDVLNRLIALEKRLENMRKDYEDLKILMRNREEFFIQQIIDQNQKIAQIMRDSYERHE